MSLNKVTVYHIGFSLSFVSVAFSAAHSLESFFILGRLGGPLSTIGLVCALVCDNAACVACVDSLSSHKFFLPLMYVVVGLLLLLEYHYLTNGHSVLWSSVLSFPPWEHKQRD